LFPYQPFPFLFVFFLIIVHFFGHLCLSLLEAPVFTGVLPPLFLLNFIPENMGWGFTWNINVHCHHWLDRPMWALAFLRNFCQLKYPAIASSDFMTGVFSRVGLSAPCPTRGYPGGPMFSVKIISLSWLVPILKLLALAWLCHINVVQEPWLVTVSLQRLRGLPRNLLPFRWRVIYLGIQLQSILCTCCFQLFLYWSMCCSVVALN
jgi:hypothetical protein